MAPHRASAAPWVQLLQALVARELVDELGVPSYRAAQLLGLAPSAVSQYLSGRRLRGPLLEYATDRRARQVAREVAEQLTDPRGDLDAGVPRLLAGAARLAETLGRAAAVERGPTDAGRSGPSSPQMRRWLRRRVRAEQEAVSRCMRLAQKARDELTRAIFRQIAADSLRHAEIVASLEPYLARGIVRAQVSGVTRKEVLALIEGERRAEADGEGKWEGEWAGTPALLLASMEADEKKHAELLEGLLRATVVGEPRAGAAR